MGYPCFLDHLYFMNMFKNIYSIQEKLGALYSAEFDTRCWEVNNIMQDLNKNNDSVIGFLFR